MPGLDSSVAMVASPNSALPPNGGPLIHPQGQGQGHGHHFGRPRVVPVEVAAVPAFRAGGAAVVPRRGRRRLFEDEDSGTPGLSESMKRRLRKEQEAMEAMDQAEDQPQQQVDGAYPALPPAGEDAAPALNPAHNTDEDADDDERMRQRLDGLPKPPPEYPTSEKASTAAVAAAAAPLPAAAAAVQEQKQGQQSGMSYQWQQKHPHRNAGNGYHHPRPRYPNGVNGVNGASRAPSYSPYYNNNGGPRVRVGSHTRLNGRPDPQFEGKVGTFRLATEWLISLLLDAVFLFAEFLLNLWLALLLKDQGHLGQYQFILCLFFVPSVVNAFVWVRLSKAYSNRIGFVFMLAVTFFGFPSPMFVYIWHLYLTAFCNQAESQRSKILANTFRLIQALTSSFPLLVLNFYTILSVMKVEGEDALNISQLTAHLEEVRVHGLAAVVSFVNLLRAASLFNERKTFTLLFVMVGFPFLNFTLLSRVLAAAAIAAFLDPWWTVVLALGLILTNVALYYVCRKRSPVPGSGGQRHEHHLLTPKRLTDKEHFQLHEMTGATTAEVIKTNQPNRDVSGLNNRTTRSSLESLEVKCCAAPSNPCAHPAPSEGGRSSSRGSMDAASSATPNDSVVLAAREDELSFWQTLPKTLLLSACSAVVPVAYTNDYRSHHPRIKGGLFILLNYVFNMLWIGLALGFTILNHVPNTLHGVSLPQPSLKVEVPGSKVIVQAGGLDVALNLPNTRLDLGSMPTFSATLNTDSTDLQHAIMLPALLALFAFPFVVMRAAMMELDCFVVRRKELDSVAAAGDEEKNEDEVDSLLRPGGVPGGGSSLRRSVRRNVEDRELKSRLYLTVCCSVLGMCIFTVLMVVAGAVAMMNLK